MLTRQVGSAIQVIASDPVEIPLTLVCESTVAVEVAGRYAESSEDRRERD
jgi:hypothetical protein